MIILEGRPKRVKIVYIYLDFILSLVSYIIIRIVIMYSHITMCYILSLSIEDIEYSTGGFLPFFFVGSVKNCTSRVQLN